MRSLFSLIPQEGVSCYVQVDVSFTVHWILSPLLMRGQTGRLLIDGVSHFHLRGDNSRSGKQSPVCWDRAAVSASLLRSTWPPGLPIPYLRTWMWSCSGLLWSAWDPRMLPESLGMQTIWDGEHEDIFWKCVQDTSSDSYGLLTAGHTASLWQLRKAPSYSAIALVRYPYCEGHIHYPKEPK